MSDSWNAPEMAAAREQLREAIEHLNRTMIEHDVLAAPPDGSHAVMTHFVAVAGWQAIGDSAWDDATAVHQYYIEPQSTWITLGLLQQAAAQLQARVVADDD